MFGAPPETRDAAWRDCRAVAGNIDLQSRSDEHVTGVEAGDLAKHAVRPQGTVVAGEVHIAAGRHVVVHSHLAAEGMDLLDPAALDGRDQRGMRIERPVSGYLPLEAKLFAIGRQQKFDGCRGENQYRD